MKGVAVVLFANVDSPTWCTKGDRFTIRRIDGRAHASCRDIQKTKKDVKKIDHLDCQRSWSIFFR